MNDESVTIDRSVLAALDHKVMVLEEILEELGERVRLGMGISPTVLKTHTAMWWSMLEQKAR